MQNLRPHHRPAQQETLGDGASQQSELQQILLVTLIPLKSENPSHKRTRIYLLYRCHPRLRLKLSALLYKVLMIWPNPCIAVINASCTYLCQAQFIPSLRTLPGNFSCLAPQFNFLFKCHIFHKVVPYHRHPFKYLPTDTIQNCPCSNFPGSEITL